MPKQIKITPPGGQPEYYYDIPDAFDAIHEALQRGWGVKAVTVSDPYEMGIKFDGRQAIVFYPASEDVAENHRRRIAAGLVTNSDSIIALLEEFIDEGGTSYARENAENLLLKIGATVQDSPPPVEAAPGPCDACDEKRAADDQAARTLASTKAKL